MHIYIQYKKPGTIFTSKIKDGDMHLDQKDEGVTIAVTSQELTH